MKNAKLIFIGKPKYSGIEEIVSIFKKRINSYIDLEEYFLKEKDFNESKNLLWLDKEIKRIAKKNEFKLIVFSPEGKEYSSFEFSNEIFLLIEKYDSILFLIGGKEGVPEKIKSDALKIISFSKMIFGHQIFRIMLYEQLYRAIAIKYNLKYI